jgi:hypothetical protein
VRPEDGRPQDLGCFVGYRIAKSYYETAGDRPRAMRELSGVVDYPALPRASGYEGGAGRRE